MSSAPEYKDLDELRLEWLVVHTREPVTLIATRLGRTPGAVRRKMAMMGLSMTADRYGRETAWSGK